MPGETIDQFVVQSIVVPILTSAAVSGGVIFLVKTWVSEKLKNAIKNEYDQKLETHKIQLKSQADAELEKTKAALLLANKEREVIFSKLHEKRAEILAETHRHLIDLHRDINSYVAVFEPAGGPSREDRRKKATDTYNTFQEYYTSKSIYFPKTIEDKLNKINEEMRSALLKFMYTVDLSKAEDTTKNWMEIFERVQKEIKDALQDIQADFRSLLGV